MYKVCVLTHQNYKVATFEAGSTMYEASMLYKDLIQSGLYAGYCIQIELDIYIEQEVY